MKEKSLKPASKFNLKRLFRQIHYWLSLAVFLPSGIILAAGILLSLKKEIAWIQPESQRGALAGELPTVGYGDMLAASRTFPEAGIESWSDIARIDIQPEKGIAKLTSRSDWELQIDTSSGEVLSSAYRRSDTIERIHDGSFFASWVKLYVFLPTGVLLFVMWTTGIYLFLLPQLTRRRKRRL